MKKLFISQPMNGKSDEEIFNEREEAIKEASEKLGEEVELLDSYCHEDRTPLGYLAYSIEVLSKADIAYFAKGWQDHRGCVIEERCATDYGIETIYSELDAHKITVLTTCFYIDKMPGIGAYVNAYCKSETWPPTGKWIDELRGSISKQLGVEENNVSVINMIPIANE